MTLRFQLMELFQLTYLLYPTVSGIIVMYLIIVCSQISPISFC